MVHAFLIRIKGNQLISSPLISTSKIYISKIKIELRTQWHLCTRIMFGGCTSTRPRPVVMSRYLLAGFPRTGISCRSLVAGEQEQEYFARPRLHHRRGRSPANGWGEETGSTAVGKTCTPTRESRHENHAITHDHGNWASTSERWEGNGRGLREGLNWEEAYKKVANEGKMVRTFDTETERKRAFNNQYQKQALRLVANVPRNTKPSYLTWVSEGLCRKNNRRALTCFCVRRNFWRRKHTRRDPDRGRVDRAESLVVVERVTRISHQQITLN